jgi:hypothetical protein
VSAKISYKPPMCLIPILPIENIGNDLGVIDPIPLSAKTGNGILQTKDDDCAEITLTIPSGNAALDKSEYRCNYNHFEHSYLE